jgi:hypothetical protein
MWQRIAAMIMIGLMCPLASAGIAGGMLPVSGGHVSAIVCGPPVYDYFTDACGGFAYIAYPVENQSFFFPEITPNITFVLGNTVSPLCSYSVGGLFNNFSCANGNNSIMVTLPEGNPTTIVLLVRQTDCLNLTNSTNVHVYYRGGYGYEKRKLLLILAIFVVFAPFIAEYYRRRKRKVI